MLNKCCISINAKCNLACKYCHFYENENLDMTNIESLNTQKLDRILANILQSKKHRQQIFKSVFRYFVNCENCYVRHGLCSGDAQK